MGYFGEIGDGDVVSVWEKKTGSLLYQVFSTHIDLCHIDNKHILLFVMKITNIISIAKLLPTNRVYPHILFNSREWKDQ